MPISVRGGRDQSADWPTELGTEVGATSRREKLANNTPLWIACLIAILAVSVILIATSGGKAVQDPKLMQSLAPGETPKGSYFDAEHQGFVEKFLAMERKRGIIVEAEFMSDKEFKVVAPSDVGFDEIAYLSRFAALGIKRHFGIGAIVYAYNKDNKSPRRVRLTATTQWSDREHTFITKPERAMEAE